MKVSLTLPAVLFASLLCSGFIRAQETSPETTVAQSVPAPAPEKAAESNAAKLYEIEHPGGRSIEDLNLRGAYISLPPFSDSLFGEDNPVRQSLARHGIAIQHFGDTTFTYNTLTPPVPLDEQTYNGQRPTWKTSHYLMGSWDLRQLGVRGGQFYMIGSLQDISWNPGGPNAHQFSAIAYYQSLFHDKLELKGGYFTNDFEFVGTAIGGQASSGSLGVFASLPIELGMSYTPLSAPGFNFNVHLPKHFYTKVGLQRSIDPKGGVSEVDRDHVGLRFAPKGDKMLTIYEGGYKQAADQNHKEMWLRGGYFNNQSQYTNMRTGKTSTNYMYYVLADRQLTKVDAAKPYRGLYTGFTQMYAPPDRNSYTQYYEARMYMIGPFAKHPNDLVSVVASHTAYSEYTKAIDRAAGQSVWNNASSITGSYNARLYRGLYFSPGLSYTHGPAITPRAKSSLNVLAQFNIFF
jgi:porin